MTTEDQNTTLAVADRRYKTLVDEISHTLLLAEEDVLLRYHHIGKLYADFEAASETPKYRSRTVDKLLEDLVARGAMSDAGNGRRFLYWARDVYSTYPDSKALSDLAHKGVGVSHLKMLLPLAVPDRQLIEAQMFDQNGRAISTRQLAEKIDSAKSQLKATPVDRIRESLDAPPMKSVSAEVTGEPTEAASTSVDAAPLATPEQAPAADETTKGVTKSALSPREKSIQNPVKVIGKAEKVCSQLLEALPDAIIAIKESSSIGFDKDSAHQAFKKALSELRSVLRSIHETVPDVLSAVEAEI